MKRGHKTACVGAALGVVACFVCFLRDDMSYWIARVQGRVRDYGPGHSRICCVSNLKQIQSAKEMWMLEQRKTTNDVPPDSDLFGGPPAFMFEKPTCPSAGTYTIGKVGEKAKCSVEDHTLSD
jgi:hypothetical protein